MAGYQSAERLLGTFALEERGYLRFEHFARSSGTLTSASGATPMEKDLLSRKIMAAKMLIVALPRRRSEDNAIGIPS
jgi:hypothetical protein